MIQLAKNNDVELYITDYIDDKVEMFSSWEAKKIHIMNYKLEKRKVFTAIIEVEKYIDILLKKKYLNYRQNFLDKNLFNFIKYYKNRFYK